MLSLQQRIICNLSQVDVPYEEEKTAILLVATLLGDSGSSLVLGTVGDAPGCSKAVLAHASVEQEAFPLCYLVSSSCQRGTCGRALKSHFIIVNFQ